MTGLSLTAKDSPHYLECELNELIASDVGMWNFLQQGSLDGVWYWNLENPDDEWMSPHFWRVFGIDPATKEHSPTAWQDIIFEDDLEVALQNFRKHCDDPSHPYDQIVRYRHADGSVVWVCCRGIAIRNEAGKPIRMLGAHNDVTAVKRAEEEALREKAKLKLANAELKAFTYGVSHDLKSPSRTALQLVQEGLMDEDGILTDDQRELFEGAAKTLERMQTLISDLLDYGILVDDKPFEETVSLKEVVEAVVADLKTELADTGATVEIGDLPTIIGYRSQMRMLVQNMISNGIKYRRADVPPVLSVSSGDAQDGALPVMFTDNACGIPETQFDKIFHVFTRLHRQEEVNGSGVGLAICKRAALNHEADISVQSQIGSGTTFSINMPTWRCLS